MTQRAPGAAWELEAARTERTRRGCSPTTPHHGSRFILLSGQTAPPAKVTGPRAGHPPPHGCSLPNVNPWSPWLPRLLLTGSRCSASMASSRGSSQGPVTTGQRPEGDSRASRLGLTRRPRPVLTAAPSHTSAGRLAHWAAGGLLPGTADHWALTTPCRLCDPLGPPATQVRDSPVGQGPCQARALRTGPTLPSVPGTIWKGAPHTGKPHEPPATCHLPACMRAPRCASPWACPRHSSPPSPRIPQPLLIALVPLHSLHTPLGPTPHLGWGAHPCL